MGKSYTVEYAYQDTIQVLFNQRRVPPEGAVFYVHIVTITNDLYGADGEPVEPLFATRTFEIEAGPDMDTNAEKAAAVAAALPGFMATCKEELSGYIQ